MIALREGVSCKNYFLLQRGMNVGVVHRFATDNAIFRIGEIRGPRPGVQGQRVRLTPTHWSFTSFLAFGYWSTWMMAGFYIPLEPPTTAHGTETRQGVNF